MLSCRFEPPTKLAWHATHFRAPATFSRVHRLHFTIGSQAGAAVGAALGAAVGAATGVAALAAALLASCRCWRFKWSSSVGFELKPTGPSDWEYMGNCEQRNGTCQARASRLPCALVQAP